eukprot:Skav229814  [mRNA]  locus=scaffold567:384863:385384:- [translate_table: standard]
MCLVLTAAMRHADSRSELESRRESQEKENSELKADVRALEGDFRSRKEMGLAPEFHCCSYWKAGFDDVKNCRYEKAKGTCIQLTTNPKKSGLFATTADSDCDDSTPACE